MTLADNGKWLVSLAEASQHLNGGSFASSEGGPVLTYSFQAATPGAMPLDAADFSRFTPAQIRATELALQAWSDVANIAFERVVGGSDYYSGLGTLRFADFSTGAGDAAGLTYLPGAVGDRSSGSLEGDVWINSTFNYNVNPEVLGYGQSVLVHEIGHALGLTHLSDYEPGNEFSYGASAQIFQDSRQYTVMSYFNEANTGADFAGAFPSGPQLLDIAAIQRAYGANSAAFLGDTTYGFHATAARPWFQAATAASELIFSVWDAGGTDTFDFSGFQAPQRIDLLPGAFSDVGGLKGNVSIALGTWIENALGGSGADLVLGNERANVLLGMDGDDNLQGRGGDDVLNGNGGADTVQGGKGDDTLNGGQGNDVLVGGLGDDLLSGDMGDDILVGGGGADRFVLRAGGGHDWVADFSSAEGDRVVVDSGAHFTLDTYEGQVIITLQNGETLGLAGISPSALAQWLVYA